MVVVSDTKRQCYEVNELIIVPVSGLWELRAKDSVISLGTYSTEQRAKQVLTSFANHVKQEKMLKYCSSSFTKEEIKELSKYLIFEFPE